MNICPCPWSIGISKKIWIHIYFGLVKVDSEEIHRHFVFWRHGTRLASFIIVPQNCIFWGATFELIKNLATLVLKKLTGFYETLLYHSYTLVPLPHSCWPRMVWCVMNIFHKNGMIIANGTICYSVKWRLLLLLLVKKECSSFVWNSQGAVFYAHRSERLWFADRRHIFYFSKKKRHVKRKKQLAQIIKTRTTNYI